MTRYSRLGRRAALLLTLLALLAVGTLGQVPAAGAAGPSIWVSQLDAHTIQIHGSGFTPGGTAGYDIHNLRYNLYSNSALVAVSPYSFWCDRYRCYSSGGTFTATEYVFCGYMDITAYDYVPNRYVGQASNTVTVRTC
jgi:hypothetical protein